MNRSSHPGIAGRSTSPTTWHADGDPVVHTTLTRQKAGTSRWFGHANENSADAGMVPLVNVVFLLMIFFLLAGTLAKRDALPITPAKSASERPRGQTPDQIGLLADGSLLLNGEAVSLAELGARLAPDTTAPASPEPRRLEIRADQAVSAGDLKRLLRYLETAAVGEITLLTRAR